MRKDTIQFDSPLDSLVSLTKRLAQYETRYGLASEEFYDQFHKGLTEDSEDFVEWANSYQHYISIRREIENRLEHAA